MDNVLKSINYKKILDVALEEVQYFLHFYSLKRSVFQANALRWMVDKMVMQVIQRGEVH